MNLLKSRRRIQRKIRRRWHAAVRGATRAGRGSTGSTVAYFPIGAITQRAQPTGRLIVDRTPVFFAERTVSTRKSLPSRSASLNVPQVSNRVVSASCVAHFAGLETKSIVAWLTECSFPNSTTCWSLDRFFSWMPHKNRCSGPFLAIDEEVHRVIPKGFEFHLIQLPRKRLDAGR